MSLVRAEEKKNIFTLTKIKATDSGGLEFDFRDMKLVYKVWVCQQWLSAFRGVWQRNKGLSALKFCVRRDALFEVCCKFIHVQEIQIPKIQVDNVMR